MASGVLQGKDYSRSIHFPFKVCKKVVLFFFNKNFQTAVYAVNKTEQVAVPLKKSSSTG